MNSDLTKQELYEGVKTLVELQEKGENAHLHLPQHKLFTLFSVAFQYLLFESTKNPGAYIIRAEDSHLAEKLAKKSKDPSTRKFMQSLMIPRKLKFQKSTFYLDFFLLQSWNLTKDIPKEKVKGAIVIKNTSFRPMNDLYDPEDQEASAQLYDLPENYYLTDLMEFVPKTVTIAFEKEFDGLKQVHFPFIKKEKERTVSGVTLASDLDWDKID